jgi:hypothetical protein
MRAALIIAFTALWSYSTFCLVMMIANRTSTEKGGWMFVWSKRGLSETGLRYRQRHRITVALAMILVLLWFLVVEPAKWFHGP